MDSSISNLHFKLMSLIFLVRDLILPRKKILEGVGIRPGYATLDFGCGPGSYIIPTIELTGPSGKVYALDIHPLAIKSVKSLISKNKLTNVETILTDCKTDLTDESVDVVLLYDTFHMLSDPDGVLKELHRVLKPEGILSFCDHHMREKEILSRVTQLGLFRLLRKGKRTYTFVKERR